MQALNEQRGFAADIRSLTASLTANPPPPPCRTHYPLTVCCHPPSPRPLPLLPPPAWQINSEKYEKLAGQLRVSALPTLILFRGGREVDRVEGMLPEPQFRQWLGRWL